MNESRPEVITEADRWVPNLYDRYRVRLPQVAIDAAVGLAQSRPRLVVDVGSGTGLSTRCWAPYADAVVGIEPSELMRAEAVAQSPQTNVSYRSGVGHAIDVPDASADIVSCQSALHWMHPSLFIPELVRVLRPGGCFIALRYRYPVALKSWEVSRAYQAFQIEIARVFGSQTGDNTPWRWADAIKAFRSHNGFRYVEELAFHAEQVWTCEQFIGWVNTMGNLQARPGDSPATDRRPRMVAELTRAVKPRFAGGPLTFHLSFNCLIAVR